MSQLAMGRRIFAGLTLNVKRKLRLVTPGAVFAVTASLLASILFSVYLHVAPSYSATYGSLGAVIVLMLWLYLLGLALFLGGEINSEIERTAVGPNVEKQTDGQRAAFDPDLESMGC
jgi:membrane protein